MSTVKYDGKALEAMSIEDLMNVQGGEVAAFEFKEYPAGAYVGMVTNLELPDAEKDYFTLVIQPTEVIELSQQTEENYALVQELVGKPQTINQRFSQGNGNARQAMLGMIAPLHLGQPVGALFGHFANGGEPLPVTFVVVAELERLKPEQKAAGQQPRTFIRLRNLAPHA